MDIIHDPISTINPKQSLTHIYGVCERNGDPSLWAEPLNVISNIAFILVAIIIFRCYRTHPDVKGKQIWDLHILTLLTFIIGVGSIAFHSLPSRITEMMDMIPIVVFIILFFLSIIVRVGKTNGFQTLICFMAFVGSTHIFVTQFPNALNDSIGYLSTMGALVMIAIYLHMKRRSSAHQFMLAALIGVISLFFRSIDNEVCTQIPIGTHFLWHSLNAVLIFILMKQLIRNVNREARIARLGRGLPPSD